MKDFATYLEGVQTVAIAGHVRPDGDCVGSCLATYNYIKDNYPKIEVELYLQPIPNIFKFLSRADEIMHSCEEDKTYDLFIAQDCGDLKRLGDAAKYFELQKRRSALTIMSAMIILQMKIIFFHMQVLHQSLFLD